MLLPVTTVTTLCLLFEISRSTNSEQELEEMFKARCQEMLLRHLYWACEKDIYRLSRRNGFQDLQLLDKYNPKYPFLSVVEARVFLRNRRGRRRRSAEPSITDECCHNSAGCTWEEYAEYCPANKRLRKFV
ncbi:putative insulin-like peptide 7 [Blattella germanica]|nr:putative insulin-like peptide 7 [Blattella germanica]